MKHRSSSCSCCVCVCVCICLYDPNTKNGNNINLRFESNPPRITIITENAENSELYVRILKNRFEQPISITRSGAKPDPKFYIHGVVACSGSPSARHVDESIERRERHSEAQHQRLHPSPLHPQRATRSSDAGPHSLDHSHRPWRRSRLRAARAHEVCARAREPWRGRRRRIGASAGTRVRARGVGSAAL